MIFSQNVGIIIPRSDTALALTSYTTREWPLDTRLSAIPLPMLPSPVIIGDENYLDTHRSHFIIFPVLSFQHLLFALHCGFLPINPTAEFGFEVEKHRARDFVELIPDLSITRFLFISFLVFCVSKTLRVFFLEYQDSRENFVAPRGIIIYCLCVDSLGGIITFCFCVNYFDFTM